VWIVSGLIGCLAQDLFQRGAPAVGKKPDADFDRLELRLPPRLEMPSRPSAEISASVEWGGNFACGGFDLRKSFRSQFDKQIGEEFLSSALEAVEGELVSDALVLACQLSPTICDAIKHYRLTASAMLALQQGQCQSIEETLSGTSQKIRARSILACLQEQQAHGATLDRAMEECRKARGVRDLSGKEVPEMEVLGELTRFLKLEDKLGDFLREIGQPIKLGGTTASLQINLGGVGAAYNRTREDLESKWREAVQSCKDGKTPAREVLEKLIPPGRAALRGGEVASLAALPEERRETVIRSLATAGAFLELAHKLEELEKRIQAAESSPTSEELGLLLEKQRDWIHSELRRLEESYRRQTIYNDALARTLRLLDVELDHAFESRFEQTREEVREKKATNEARTWGGCPNGK